MPESAFARTRSPSAGRYTRPPMDLYEYQGKELFARFGIPVSDGRLAETPEEARAAAEMLGGQVVVKAQVLTGGRGKAGGIKLADARTRRPRRPRRSSGSTSTATSSASSGSSAPRTSRTSTTSRSPSIAARSSRSSCSRARAGSTSRRSPRTRRSARAAARRSAGRLLSRTRPAGSASTAGITDPAEQKQVIAIIEKLYERVRRVRRDALRDQPADRHARGRGARARLEVHRGRQRALPPPDIAEMRDLEAYPAEERAAREKGVTYVKLDGEVGILGNGAGLVMSTLDVIAQAGGKPANFCDLGRRRRRAGRRRRARDHHRRSAGALHPLQHLRRDHPLRRGRARDPRRARAARDRRSRSSCASTGRTPRRAAGSSPRPRRRTSTSRRRCSRRRKKAVELS